MAGRTARVAICLAFIVAVTVLTSSCSVPEDGWIAIGRANDGSLRVYLRSCTHPLDGATLYWPDDPQGPTDDNSDGDSADQEVFADWTIAAAADGPSGIDWPLLGPGEATVTAERELAAVPLPPKNLALYAWTRTGTTSAGGPYQFVAADLARLGPNQLLVANITGNDRDPPNKVITRQSFNALNCAGFG